MAVETLRFTFCVHIHGNSLSAWKYTLTLNELKQISLQNSIKIGLFHLVHMKTEGTAKQFQAHLNLSRGSPSLLICGKGCTTL